MDRTRLSIFLTVGVMLSVTAVISFSTVESADAVKARGTFLIHHAEPFGLNTFGIVCGDKLCTEGPRTPLPKPELKSKPQACTIEYIPMCGIDGKTYPNTCVLKAAGTGIDHKGSCKSMYNESSKTSKTMPNK